MQSLNEKISTRLRLAYVMTDLVTTNAAMVLFNLFRWAMLTYEVSFGNFYLYPRVLWGQLCFPLMMMAIYWLSGYYNYVEKRSRAQEVVTTAGSALLGAMAIFFLAAVNDSQWSRTRAVEYVAMAFMLIFICVYAGRYIITRIARRYNKTAGIIHRGLMIGTDAEALALAGRINNSPQEDTLQITTLVKIRPDDTPASGAEKFDIINLEDLQDFYRTHTVSGMVLSPAMRPAGNTLTHLVRFAAEVSSPIFVSPDLNNLALSSKRAFNIVTEPLVCITSPNISESIINVKRAVDIAGSSLALLTIWPFMALLALKVKLDSPGPVFYRQERLGYGGKPFRIIKFRSMVSNAEPDGKACVTADNDPRITRFGRILRKYRFDELPQFWNVLRGEMSLVGPRPERRQFAEKIAARVPQYPIIYQVRPGITSWGMVRYGYASNLSQMIERLRYDLIYIENISILTDLKILLHTIRTVIGGHGK